MSARAARSAVQHREPAGTFGQLFGVLAGPLAWFAHLGATYFVATAHCVAGLDYSELWINLATLAALGVVAAAGATSWRTWRRLRDADGETAVGRARFLALAGLLFSGYFAAVIIVGDLSVFVLEPCG